MECIHGTSRIKHCAECTRLRLKAFSRIQVAGNEVAKSMIKFGEVAKKLKPQITV